MDDDWKPHKVNGPDDTPEDKASKAALVFLPIPQELKDKGVRAVTYARTFISIDYKGRIFNFSVYKEDITKTRQTYIKELDHTLDQETKDEIWLNCISANWLKHVYTEHEIERERLGGDGKADMVLELAQKNCKEIFVDEYKAAHAAVMINEHLEVLPISDDRFKN